MQQKFQKDRNTVRQLNPLVLASIGDAVYSLYMRAYFVAKQDLNARSLHSAAAKLVCAAAQKEAYYKIESMLSEEERYIARRGRNAHPGTVPKNANIMDYRTATALEAVFGYLFLLREAERIDRLIQKIWEEQHETV